MKDEEKRRRVTALADYGWRRIRILGPIVILCSGMGGLYDVVHIRRAMFAGQDIIGWNLTAISLIVFAWFSVGYTAALVRRRTKRGPEHRMFKQIVYIFLFMLLPICVANFATVIYFDTLATAHGYVICEQGHAAHPKEYFVLQSVVTATGCPMEDGRMTFQVGGL